MLIGLEVVFEGPFALKVGSPRPNLFSSYRITRTLSLLCLGLEGLWWRASWSERTRDQDVGVRPVQGIAQVQSRSPPGRGYEMDTYDSTYIYRKRVEDRWVVYSRRSTE